MYYVELTTASSTTVPPQLSCYMKEYQEFLKDKYDSLELSSPREMLDCYSTEYINLTLTRKKEDDDSHFIFRENINDSNVSLTEALDVERYKKKVILILGGPGMGKSTLAINICKQWGNGELLQGYDAVILLQLRFKKIQKAEDIKELLLTPNDELKEKVYSEIAKSNGKKICFILEGYDELPYDLQRSSVFTELTEELIKCTVICTCRPEAYSPLFTNAIKIIKINGFSKESVDRYISKAFEKLRNGREMTNQLKSQIRNNLLVRSILHIPINLAIVCLVFSHLSELPKTLTKLYTLLCIRLILRHINTRTNIKQEKLQSLDELPKNIAQQFSQLCYIAYKGIEAKMIIFSSSNLADFGVDENNLNGLDLLLISPNIFVSGREKSYNFMHLTLQEFCAAWYVSRNHTIDEQIKLMSVFDDQNQYNIVWRFYAGISKHWNKEIFDCMLPCKQVKSKQNFYKISELAHIAYETGSSEACQIVEDYFKDNSNIIYVDELDSHAINCVLENYRGTLCLFKNDTVILIDWPEKCNVDIFDQPLEEFAVQQCNNVYKFFSNDHNLRDKKSLLQALSSSKTLDTLHIKEISATKEQLECLGNSIINNGVLHTLNMICCGIQSAEADIIGEMLSHNKSIRSVDLSYNLLRDVGVEKLVHHLMNNDVLDHISLRNSLITAVGISHLSKYISKDNSSLTSIELSINPLEDEGVDLLLQSLSTRIEHVGLCDVQMTQLSCKSIVSALKNLKSISLDHLTDFKANDIISEQGEVMHNEFGCLKVINNYAKQICSNYWNVITASLLNTTMLEHIEIRFKYFSNINLLIAIGRNESIKALKLSFELYHSVDQDWLPQLLKPLQHSKSITKLIITGYLINQSDLYLIGHLAKSLALNTSIKSVCYALKCGKRNMNSKEVYMFINELKKNSTLEELILFYESRDQVSEIEHCVQQINKGRNINGVANLKVNVIDYISCEYFMDIHKAVVCL